MAVSPVRSFLAVALAMTATAGGSMLPQPPPEHCAVMGRYGTGPGEFNCPSGIAFDADRGNGRIQGRDAASGTWRVVAGSGDGVGLFMAPSGIAFAEDGVLIATDQQGQHPLQRRDLAKRTPAQLRQTAP